MSKWDSVKFSDLFREPLRNGVYKPKEFHGRGQKVINMGELFAHDFIGDQEMKRVALNDRERLSNLVEDGDLLFARRSLVLEGSGKCALVECPSEETTFESSIIRARLDRSRANPRYFYYFFKSPQGRGLVASIATRTAVSGITGSDLAQLVVPVPPLKAQSEIVSILSAYDDLIENNTRRIKILEETAQMFYREWFVHFRFPGHEKVKFVDSELGLIPSSFFVRSLGDVITFENGRATTIAEDGAFPLYGSNGVIGKTAVAKYENGIIIGRVGAYCGCTMYCREGFGATDNTIVAKPISDDMLSIEAAYYLLRTMNLRRYAGGSAQPLMTQTVLKQLPCIVPDHDTNCRFHKLVLPIQGLTITLEVKNNNLRTTRDLLLPKLISGELPLEAAEEAMEQTA